MKVATLTLVTLLIASMFFVGITTSTVEYDPWVDLDDDGDIDMFDVVNMAGRYGTSGTPINKTALLLELQSKIDSLNASLIELKDWANTTAEKLEQTKTIRFYEPNETMVDVNSVWVDAASFVWTPNNTDNNQIVSLILFYEFATIVPAGVADFDYQIAINGYTYTYSSDAADTMGVYRKSQTYNIPISRFSEDTGQGIFSYGIYPNADSYTITLRIREYYYTQGCKLYIKNVNLLLNVIDGLPIP